MKKYLYIIVILIIATAAVFGMVIFFGKNKNNDTAQAPAAAAPGFSLQSFFGVVSPQNSGNTNNVSQPASNQDQALDGASQTPNPFGTAPDASFSFAVFGDTKQFDASNQSGNLQKAVAQVKGLDLKAIFVMGDLIKSCDGGSSCEAKFNDWKSVMAPILSKTYEVVGNHDRTGGNKADAVWQKEFNLPQNGPDGYKDMVYSFDIGNTHFTVLDSEKPRTTIINSDQRDWLEKDLSSTNKAHKLVFYHEPAFQVSQNSEDGLDAHPSERDALWNIIKKYRVDAVFNGHAHIYARKKIDGVEQIVVGDTDSTNDDLVQPGLSDFGYKGKSYAIVTVTGQKINLKLFTVDGKQIESFDFT
jgi:predicted phosphodiesterase